MHAHILSILTEHPESNAIPIEPLCHWGKWSLRKIALREYAIYVLCCFEFWRTAGLHTNKFTHIHTNMYVHTCTHECTHVQTHTHTHADVHKKTYTHRHTAHTHNACVHLHLNTLEIEHVHTNPHMHTHTHAHAHTPTCIHTHTHTPTHAHTPTHTHTHRISILTEHPVEILCKIQNMPGKFYCNLSCSFVSQFIFTAERSMHSFLHLSNTIHAVFNLCKKSLSFKRTELRK